MTTKTNSNKHITMKKTPDIDEKRGARLLIVLFILLSGINIVIFSVFAFVNLGEMQKDLVTARGEALGYQISTLFHKDPANFQTALKESDIERYRLFSAEGILIDNKPSDNDGDATSEELKMITKSISSRMVLFKNYTLTLDAATAIVYGVVPLLSQNSDQHYVVISPVSGGAIQTYYDSTIMQLVYVSLLFVGFNVLFLFFAFWILVRPLRKANHLLSDQSYELQEQAQRLQDQKNEIQMLYNEAEENLELGWSIQRSLLPSFELKSLNADGSNRFLICSHCSPMEKVSGDFLDWVQLEDGSLVFMIVDVVGHGVGSALITTMVKQNFRDALETDPAPGAILELMNTRLYNTLNAERGMQYASYLTAFVARIHPKQRKIEWSNASHANTHAMSLVGSDKHSYISNGPMIATIPYFRFETITERLEPNTRFIAYSDGFSEARNEDNRFFLNEMLTIFSRTKQMKPDMLIEYLLDKMEQFLGGNLINDDRSIIVVDYQDERDLSQLQMTPEMEFFLGVNKIMGPYRKSDHATVLMQYFIEPRSSWERLTHFRTRLEQILSTLPLSQKYQLGVKLAAHELAENVLKYAINDSGGIIYVLHESIPTEEGQDKNKIVLFSHNWAEREAEHIVSEHVEKLADQESARIHYASKMKNITNLMQRDEADLTNQLGLAKMVVELEGEISHYYDSNLLSIKFEIPYESGGL